LINGGIPPTPWWLVFASAFALIAAVAVRQVVTGESLVTLVFGAPAVLGVIGVIGVVLYNVHSASTQHHVSYYGQNLGDAVAAFSLVALALLLADALSRHAPRLRESRTTAVLVGLAAILASVAVFQVDGYVGPGSKTLASNQAALGFQTRPQWSDFDHTLDPLADTFLTSVDAVRVRSAASGAFPETWSYVDIENLDVFGQDS